MFCHICASECVRKSQLDAIDQAWDPKKGTINHKIQVKNKTFIWSEETCPHQEKK